jgi:hypothetical protein
MLITGRLVNGKLVASHSQDMRKTGANVRSDEVGIGDCRSTMLINRPKYDLAAPCERRMPLGGN